ncbi:hypothetical protein [Streptomyces sp. NPDC006309]|uniref:hypothetical protein n=1 Tax=Streptomyces sp. NPDC006309 TaxID=3156749 RepID=UPI0033A146F2
MVTVISRAAPATVRHGAGGRVVRDSPAYGWATRVAVTGGPEATLSRTEKLKLRGRASAGGGRSSR